MRVRVLVVYEFGEWPVVDLPVEWSQIKSWYVKYHRLNYTTDGITWHEVLLGDDEAAEYALPPASAIDRKRPERVRIMDAAGNKIDEWRSEWSEDAKTTQESAVWTCCRHWLSKLWPTC